MPVVSNSAAAAQTFRPGPMMRPISWETFISMARTPYILFMLSGLSSLPILLSRAARHEIRHLGLAITVAAITVAYGVGVFLCVEVWPGITRRQPGLLAAMTMAAGGVLTALALVGFGPRFGALAIPFPGPVIFAFALLRLRWALTAAVLVGVEAAAVFVLQDGWLGSLGQWTYIMATTVALSALAGQLTARMIASSAAEHAARVELADVNTNLQQRVDAQVAELERAGQLRRFLAPQVADAVLSGDAEHLLRPHRRRVAVFFCDLRGFTSFAAQVEPEDVIDVLGAYYRVVGERLRASNATIGSFAGDGIMAYLNDPVPCDDPAGTAVALARTIRDELGAEVARWRRSGYDLGFGIGIAVGHATLGVVGFEGRQDYTALGTVVNLAARLCAAAAPDQILVDPRVASDLDESVAVTSVNGVALKGFPAEMAVYAVS